MANAIRRMTESSSRLVERYLPDAFLFAILLTFVAYGLTFWTVEPQANYLGHAENLIVDGWYGGSGDCSPSQCR